MALANTHKFRNIAIIHPAAIGDVMFGTPVAATLKENFPEARLTYWTHESLFSLLKLCPAIDAMAPFDRHAGIIDQRRQLDAFSADLIVDLVGSTRTKLITLFNRALVLTHNKKEFKRRTDMHIVDSLLSAVDTLNLNARKDKYPTLKTDANLFEAISKDTYQAKLSGKQIVALVPSVGTLRPHRAWKMDGWIGLIENIFDEPNIYPVLVGGKDDVQICNKIAESVNNKIENFAGKLSLPETATLLSQCALVISGDTGPAHLSVAVGTPVLGLYGPTLPSRNGPYGTINTTIENCQQCKCAGSKFCLVTPEPGPGACMQTITLDDVWRSASERLTDVSQRQ